MSLTVLCLIVLIIASSEAGSVYRGFGKLRQAEGHLEHEIVFAVQQKNRAQLEIEVSKVSDPTHPEYCQFWSRQEVADLTSNEEGSSKVRVFVCSVSNSCLNLSSSISYRWFHFCLLNLESQL